jgi:hypothetical protein
MTFNTLLKKMTTNKTQNLAPFLNIYKGMKVIIIENTYPK